MPREKRDRLEEITKTVTTDRPVLSIQYLKDSAKSGWKKFSAGYKAVGKFILDALTSHLIYLVKLANIPFNFQWKEGANIFQNIGYNMFAIDSRGRRSMHTTLMWLAALTSIIALFSEIWRFSTTKEYQFSTGFYTALTVLLGIVQIAFTSRENKKQDDDDAPTTRVEVEVTKGKQPAETDPGIVETDDQTPVPAVEDKKKTSEVASPDTKSKIFEVIKGYWPKILELLKNTVFRRIPFLSRFVK